MTSYSSTSEGLCTRCTRCTAVSKLNLDPIFFFFFFPLIFLNDSMISSICSFLLESEFFHEGHSAASDSDSHWQSQWLCSDRLSGSLTDRGLTEQQNHEALEAPLFS